MKSVAMAVLVAAGLSVGVAAFAEIKAVNKGELQPEAAPQRVMSAEGKRFIESFVGRWRADDGMFTLGEQRMSQRIRFECEKVSGGWGSVCRLRLEAKDMPAQEVTLLLGWDLAKGEAHMFEVSNTADVHNHVGRWSEDGKSITLIHEGLNSEGQQETDAMTFTWSSARELAVKGVGSSGGATVWSLSATMRR